MNKRENSNVKKVNIIFEDKLKTNILPDILEELTKFYVEDILKIK